MSRDLQPCGTMAAARRHWRTDGKPCDACREAELDYQRRRTGARPFKPAACGTVGGYRRHLREGEKTCPECRIANAQATRDGNARRAAKRGT